MQKSSWRRNLILLKELVKTDFKLRYQGSLLGYLWAVIRPLLLFAIIYLVFVKMLRFGGGIPHYPVYLMVGTVLWSFFTECTNQGIQSILQRSELLRKVKFPKIIVVLSATATALINLIINLAVVMVFVFANGVAFNITWLLVPLLIIELYFLSFGIALFFGAINVRFRDISSIWEVLLQALFYAVPIIYPITLVAETSKIMAKVIMLNPLTQIIQDIRWSLVTHQSSTVWNSIETLWIKLIPFLLVIIIFIFGLLFFNRRAKTFAEEA